MQEAFTKNDLCCRGAWQEPGWQESFVTLAWRCFSFVRHLLPAHRAGQMRSPRRKRGRIDATLPEAQSRMPQSFQMSENLVLTGGVSLVSLDLQPNVNQVYICHFGTKHPTQAPNCSLTTVFKSSLLTQIAHTGRPWPFTNTRSVRL